MNNEQNIEGLTYRIKNALFGFIVGDALGVPYEFMPREKINEIEFCVGGKHGMPVGVWSDDSSMMLCLVETYIENGLDFELYSKKIIDWASNGYMTPTGKPFGIGRTTFFSIMQLKKGISYLESGEKGENSNGNGSLMRVVPLAFILNNDEKRFKIIEEYSAITHAHKISKISCSIYVVYLQELIKTNDKIKAYKNMQEIIKNHYKQESELIYFKGILEESIFDKDASSLSGLGYVISTLEVVLHSFINGNSFKNCVLNAIKIGNDTDTNAALTGALAGYYYNELPESWVKKLLKYDFLEETIDNFITKL